MKKTLLFSLVALLGIMQLNAQTTEGEETLKKQKEVKTEGWQTGGSVGLDVTQTALKNWSAGGQNSIALNSLLSLFATYKKGEGVWENYLDLGYGTIKQEGNKKWWKTDDKIDFTSKYGRKAFGNWYYAALLNFKTQMTAGFNYPDDSTEISNFMTPGYLLGAIGMDYRPSDNFTVFVSPLTTKITFVNDQDFANAGAFGVDPAVYDNAGKLVTPGKKSRVEMGGYVRIFFKQQLMNNVDFQTKLDLFSNYLEKPQNIDVNWEVLVNMKVNDYISAKLFTQLIYDDDIDIAYDKNDPSKVGPRIQFKEVLGVGFNYKF